MKVKIINKSEHPLPQYHSSEAAGMDIRAYLDENIELKPLQRALIPTGIYIELTEGYEAQIRPRSGLAIKHGITLLNTPGTIDADYRGEIKIIIINLSDVPFVIKNGERIAQMVISRHERIEWEKVEVLNNSDREGEGFGSTGN